MTEDEISYLLLQKRHEEYLTLKQGLFSEYMQLMPQFKEVNLFFCMNGCQENRLRERHPQKSFSAKELERLFSDTSSNSHNGGYFLRWNQTGICINPSEGFLQRFCEFGHHIWEIDVIIVTSSTTDASQELGLLHKLNQNLNRMLLSYEQEPHVIRYFLHPTVYARTSLQLRPVFREEKGSVVCLEAFQQEEKFPLNEQITLFYANATEQALMIRLEMPGRLFGYLSDALWESHCSQFFQECDVLLIGFGKTTREDLEGLENRSFASLNRCKKELSKLRLLLVAEFDDSLGDIRFEIIKKLKQHKDVASHVFPLDHGFILNLETLMVKTDTNLLPPYHLTPCQEVHVVRTKEAFSQLLYLSANDIL